MPFRAKILANGAKNVRVLVTGVLACDIGPVKIIKLDDLLFSNTPPAGLKVESAVWLVQEKMVIKLWWGIGELEPGRTPEYPEVSPENLIFIMESRNSVRFDHGLDSPRAPDKWDRSIWMEVEQFTVPPTRDYKHFTFVLDFDKQ